VVDNMVELLEPMLIMTKLLFSSLYPTVFDVCLTFLGLYHHLSKFLDNELQTIKRYMIADSIRFKLNEYWFIFEESTSIATILNLSSKLLTFPTGDKKDAALTSLRNTIAHYNILATTITNPILN
ncbi:3218_t:CDS:1, partial [Dentiscutata heterogama]